MKKFIAITLGILTAIGGFVDIGDLVANAETGARFKLSLAWVVLVGVLGIIVYAEMAGRVAAMSKRPVFDLVRERLGPGFGFANLAASFFINFLTLTAEIAGVAIAISLVSSVNYLLLLPVTGFLVWLVIWRMPFEWMERIFGLMGLALLVFAVTVWKIGPDWNHIFHQALHPAVPSKETPFTYAYFGIALFGAAMTPYEVFFFSSGGVEEKWTKSDLNLNRANVFVGFPLGAFLSLAIMLGATLVLAPRHISVDSLSQVALPTAFEVGKVGLAVLILGIFAATFGAALETAMSAGYIVAQFFGWTWGKFTKARHAARFHLVVLMSIVAGVLFGLSGVDPIKVTEYSIVLSAAALPLTYFPILVIANDRDYMGDEVNGPIVNGLATIYLIIILLIAVATIPLMIITKAGA
ncbi:MAG: divalent metal cation transporter [Actinobacteria bacterium]|nr:divalent metal cation transporter [Actinomycetota bacterium]